MGALCRRVERVNRLTACHEQAVAMFADEAEVRRAFRHENLPDLRAVWRVHVDAVDPFAAESSAAPDVAVDVGADAVMKSGVEHSKLAAVRQLPAVILHVPPNQLRLLFWMMRRRGVCDINEAVVRREAQSVRLEDFVGELRNARGLCVD